MQGAVDQGAWSDRRRQREAAPHVALAPAEHRRVDREHQRLVTRRGGAVDHLLHHRPVAPCVHLEPEPPVADGAYLFDRAGAQRREGVGKAGACGGAGHGELTLRIGDPCETGGREHQWIGERRAEEARGNVDLRDAAQHARSERGGREGALVRGEGALVLGRAVDVVEYAARKPALGDATQVGHRRRAAEPALDRVGLEPLEADDRPERLEHHRHGSGAQAAAVPTARGQPSVIGPAAMMTIEPSAGGLFWSQP